MAKINVWNIHLGHQDYNQNWCGGPNSAGGVSVGFSFKNNTEKTIKYAVFAWTPYNAVDDAMQCTIRGVSTTRLSNNTESMPQTNETTSSTIIVSPFIGEWKANVVVGNSDAGKEYAIYTITLNSDGKATYRDKVGTWAYYEEQQKISLTFPEGIVGLTVSEENGKTILKYFQDTYYRAEEFVEFN